jgi:hypothetical protein
MHERSALPDTNRLSVLAAMILLAYALTRFVTITPVTTSYSLLGVQLQFEVDFRTIVAIMVAALAAIGTDWLLRDHPALARMEGEPAVRTYQHWILPGLTAWVIGVPLANFSTGPAWWIVFLLGGVLLILVFAAEYAVVDVSDVAHPVATVVLGALSFALYLMLAITIKSAGLRLYQILPALVPAAGLVSIRTLYLRLGGRWLFAWVAVIMALISQFVIGLHYWPISPVRYGLFLLGPTYALTSLAAGLSDNAADPDRGWLRILTEPVLMLLLVWGLAFLFP